MKKMISLLMALVMVFALAACGSSPDILGTYEAEIDLTDLVCDEFDKGAEITGTGISLSNHLTDFKIVMISQFNEDGTYSQTIDSASLERAMGNMKNAIIPVMDDFLLYTFKQEFVGYGYTINTREDVEGILNIAWDDIYSSVLGVDLNEFVDEMINELSADMFEDTLLLEGNYKAEDGKLFLSDGLEYNIDENVYETYEIDGDTVTITGGVNVEEEELLPYPYTMTKVS
ncbi:MAG: hypothetical protein IJD81_09040 [Oscillospiraceae bacterium]|nr:hypothetical protein [Oscillospiraceae bacterium]